MAAVGAAATFAIGGCAHATAVGSVEQPVSQGTAVPGQAASAPIPQGPGPTSPYTVAAQPAPGTCHYRYTPDQQPLPDPACTPGAVNPKVTQASIADTICRSGYTSSIRPASTITGREKTANAKSYAYTGSSADAEYDHLISLELGGDPNDPRNLWVEPPSPDHKPGGGVNNPKDKVENILHSLICSGQVPLDAAQAAIAIDWTTALTAIGH